MDTEEKKSIVSTEENKSGKKVDAKTNLSAIGIDLGTTHSGGAYLKKGIFGTLEGVHADMIPINMEEGRTTLPSIAKI